MININTVSLSLEAIAHDDEVLLINISPIKQFVEGKATDKISSYKYTFVCPKNKFQNFSIKLTTKPTITNLDLDRNGGSLRVKLVNFSASLFQGKDKVIYLSAKADDIVLVD